MGGYEKKTDFVYPQFKSKLSRGFMGKYTEFPLP